MSQAMSASFSLFSSGVSSHEAVLKAVADLIGDHPLSPADNHALLLVQISNYGILLHVHGASFCQTLFRECGSLMALSLEAGDRVLQDSSGEYMVVLLHASRSVGSLEPTIEAVERFLREYSVGHAVEGKPYQIISKISVVPIPSHASTVVDALYKATVTMHCAPFAADHTYHYYDEIITRKEGYRSEMALAQELQRVLMYDHLRLAFQPIICAKTGKTMYYESLLRILDERGRLISAGPFIPVAERMGLIYTIDERVFQLVVDEIRQSKDLILAFNLSNHALSTERWIRYAEKILGNTPDIAERIIVEITETAVQENLSKAAYFVASLQAMGCQVALDDFGSGYTSFRQLKALPLDIIKIDGSFVRDIVNNPHDRMFVKVILDISESFGLKTVAEFVENGEIAKQLMDLNVDFMQGNYFSPAVHYRPWIQNE